MGWEKKRNQILGYQIFMKYIISLFDWAAREWPRGPREQPRESGESRGKLERPPGLLLPVFFKGIPDPYNQTADVDLFDGGKIEHIG
jgi:hypothetical protein